MLSIFRSELFNFSNKVVAAIPSDTGENNKFLDRFQLGHPSYPRAANLIDEIISFMKPDGGHADVRFRAAYLGYNRIVRTNPGDTLFIGPAHKMIMCGGDIIMMGKMVEISYTDLLNYVGMNKDFYNKVMRIGAKGPAVKRIYVPSTISAQEYKSVCSIAGAYRIDEPTGLRFDATVKLIEERIDKINDYSNEGWDKIKVMHENLTDMLRINKTQSIVVRDANNEMKSGGRISEPDNDRNRRGEV